MTLFTGNDDDLLVQVAVDLEWIELVATRLKNLLCRGSSRYEHWFGTDVALELGNLGATPKHVLLVRIRVWMFNYLILDVDPLGLISLRSIHLAGTDVTVRSFYVWIGFLTKRPSDVRDTVAVLLISLVIREVGLPTTAALVNDLYFWFASTVLTQGMCYGSWITFGLRGNIVPSGFARGASSFS